MEHHLRNWLCGCNVPPKLRVSSQPILFYHSEMTPNMGLMSSLEDSSPLPKVHISTGIIIHLFLTIQGKLNRYIGIQEKCRLQPSPCQTIHLPLRLLSICTTMKTHHRCSVLRKSTRVFHVQFNTFMTTNQQLITVQ